MASPEHEANERLRLLIASLRGSKGQASPPPPPPGAPPPGPPPQAPGAPAQPAAGAGPGAPSGEWVWFAFLKERLDGLERELAREREESRAARAELERLRKTREEVETQLKEIQAQKERSRSQGRIEQLETRLEELQRALLTFLSKGSGGIPGFESLMAPASPQAQPPSPRPEPAAGGGLAGADPAEAAEEAVRQVRLAAPPVTELQNRLIALERAVRQLQTEKAALLKAVASKDGLISKLSKVLTQALGPGKAPPA
ncbi:MAG: hypothetical protein HY554_13135 [Elusimicrobia bacterium]|nr:hypothetical protein [Elusimicrobiota bacterium]